MFESHCQRDLTNIRVGGDITSGFIDAGTKTLYVENQSGKQDNCSIPSYMATFDLVLRMYACPRIFRLSISIFEEEMCEVGHYYAGNGITQA